MTIEAAARGDDAAFFALVDERADRLREFLDLAARWEAGGSSLRFEHRPDLDRCRTVLPLFGEAWWGVVVYSCFDSINGTNAVAAAFGEPLPTEQAECEIDRISFPTSSVQNHRAQVTLTRAKRSLVSACAKSEDLKHALTTPGPTFDERFGKLDRIHVWAWGRTTNFDVLGRAGVLAVDGTNYRPTQAYLLSSKGPAAGFEQVWGIRVTATNAYHCEQLLVRWTEMWNGVSTRVGVRWVGSPYDSADFENALCVLQERH